MLCLFHNSGFKNELIREEGYNLTVNLGELDIRELEYFPNHKKLRVLFGTSCFPKEEDIKAEVIIDLVKLWQGIQDSAGSDTIFIKEARMRFPGRRGSADKCDFHLYPLSLFEFIRLKHNSDISSSPELILKEFENNYLKHGGFLTAINDYEKNQKITPATYRTYSDWVRGDFLKRGKQESYLIEVLKAIIKTYGTQVTWNGLANHTSISHHDTVRLYVELLESMDVLFIQHALREDELAAAQKKNLKK